MDVEQTAERPLARTPEERLAALSRRNSALTRQNGALEQSRQETLKTLAHVALVAGGGNPNVAREIVSICQQVADDERRHQRWLSALRP